ncbi:hypothetical protein PvNV_066 [Penaeus vannamei nudivirus]|nr:hypothetical protein PvSNPV_066 [Penaeus vannamei nucleopolyhedrovirus]
MPSKNQIINGVQESIRRAMNALQKSNASVNQFSIKLLGVIKAIKNRERSIENEYKQGLEADIGIVNRKTELQSRLKTLEPNSAEYKELLEELEGLPPSSNGKAYMNIVGLDRLIKRTDNMLDAFYKSFSEDKEALNEIDFELKEKLLKLNQSVSTNQIKVQEDGIIGAIALNQMVTTIQTKINNINILVGKYNYYMNIFNALVQNLKGDVINYKNVKGRSKKTIHINITDYFEKLTEMTKITSSDIELVNLLEYIQNSESFAPLEIERPLLGDLDVNIGEGNVFSSSSINENNFNIGMDFDEINTSIVELQRVNTNAKVVLTEEVWNNPQYTWLLFMRYLELLSSHGGSIATNTSKIDTNYDINVVRGVGDEDPNLYRVYAVINNKLSIYCKNSEKQNIDIRTFNKSYATLYLLSDISFEKLTLILYALVINKEPQIQYYSFGDTNIVNIVKNSLVNNILYNTFVKYDTATVDENIEIENIDVGNAPNANKRQRT